MQPNPLVAATCRNFTNLAENLSELTAFCFEHQYFCGFDGVNSNDYEWYDFVKFLSNPENLDYWGINDGLLDDETKAHPYVVQFVPYLFTLHGRRIVANSKTKAFQDAFDRIYAKIGSLKTSEGSHKVVPVSEGSHLHNTIYSSEWIRECLVELMSNFVEIKGNREITVIQKKVPHTCESDNDHSRSNVYIHLSASGFDISNVKYLHTIANALYSVLIRVMEETNYEGPMILADMQMLVSNTIMGVMNLQEQVETLKVDRKKFIEYFKKHTPPSVFAKLLDICLVYDTNLNRVDTFEPFEIESTNYRVFSAFCKLFYENTVKSANNELQSFSHNAFVLPQLHIGQRKSKIADEIHDYQYYRYISERFGSYLTTDEFISRINKDHNMDLLIERIPSMGQMGEVRTTLKFYVDEDKNELTLNSISVIIDKYLAIIEYLYTQFGLHNFYCYGYMVDSKPFKTSPEEWKLINEHLLLTYENGK